MTETMINLLYAWAAAAPDECALCADGHATRFDLATGPVVLGPTLTPRDHAIVQVAVQMASEARGLDWEVRKIAGHSATVTAPGSVEIDKAGDTPDAALLSAYLDALRTLKTPQ